MLFSLLNCDLAQICGRNKGSRKKGRDQGGREVGRGGGVEEEETTDQAIK